MRRALEVTDLRYCGCGSPAFPHRAEIWGHTHVDPASPPAAKQQHRRHDDLFAGRQLERAAIVVFLAREFDNEADHFRGAIVERLRAAIERGAGLGAPVIDRPTTDWELLANARERIEQLEEFLVKRNEEIQTLLNAPVIALFDEAATRTKERAAIAAWLRGHGLPFAADAIARGEHQAP
jgi:hypothetical protein